MACMPLCWGSFTILHLFFSLIDAHMINKGWRKTNRSRGKPICSPTVLDDECHITVLFYHMVKVDYFDKSVFSLLGATFNKTSSSLEKSSLLFTFNTISAALICQLFIKTRFDHIPSMTKFRALMDKNGWEVLKGLLAGKIQ